MRFAVVFAALFAGLMLPACQEQGSAANAQPAAGAVESQADFVTRCTRETIASNPESRSWAQGNCEQVWAQVLAAGPMADAILAAVPAPGEAVAGSAVRARVAAVQWMARPDGALVAQGRLGDAEVQVEAAALNFFWQETGAMIPFEVVEALKGRGANVAMVGCTQLGVGEFSKTYRVEAPGRAPFALGIYDRMAPTANANSFYNVSVNLSRRVPTLAQLRAGGEDVSATCAY
jgi:hypothetical protein